MTPIVVVAVGAGGRKASLVSWCVGWFINGYEQWADSGDVDVMIGGLAGR